MSKSKEPNTTDAIWSWVDVPESLESSIRVKGKTRPQSKRDHLINKAIGSEIKRLRKDKGLTMIEISKKLSITQAQFSYYENAQDCFSVATLYDIADVLGVTIRHFIDIGEKSIDNAK